MSLVRYISAHFNRHSTLSPSLRVMKVVTIVGIAMATATLIVTLAILTGFEREYRRTILDFNAHLVLLKAGETDAMADVSDLIGSRESIKGATPFLYREGLMLGGGSIKGVIMKGIDVATFRDVNPMRIMMPPDLPTLESALPPTSTKPYVILGAGLAKSMKLAVKDLPATVRFLVPTSAVAKGEDKFKELKVLGIFDAGLYDYDAQFALMALPALRTLFELPESRTTGVELVLDDPDNAKELAKWFEGKLGPVWRAVPWSELNAEIFKAVEMEKTTFSLIMGVLMVVAAFNIIGVLVLMILMRTGEIAILRSLGMTQRALVRVFTRGGLIIGVLGVGIGTAVGIGLALILARFDIVHIAPEIYFLNRLPIDISPLVCGIIAVFCIAACWCTSWLAATKLARLPIVEGLNRA